MYEHSNIGDDQHSHTHTHTHTHKNWYSFISCCDDDDDDDDDDNDDNAFYIIIPSTSPMSSLLSSFPIKILHTFLISPMNASPSNSQGLDTVNVCGKREGYYSNRFAIRITIIMALIRETIINVPGK